MTTKTLTLVATNAAGSAQATAQVTVADAPPPPPPPTGANEFTFTEGVQARASLAALIDPAATRTQGGYFYRVNLYSGEEFNHVWYDPATKELCYDGGKLNAYNKINPSSDYWIGSELAPTNPTWQFPPTVMKIPQPVGTTVRAIVGGSKHTRPRYCPRDGLVHIFGGDYSSAGLINDGHQDGRMTFWNWNPVTNAWALNYPALGRPGEDQPLSPDVMGFAWDKTREIWWITWGDARAGVPANSPADDPKAIASQCWTSLGGLSTAWPKACGAGAAAFDGQWPVFVFDPKQGKYTKLAYQPWDARLTIQMRESIYDDASKRLYMMRPYGNGVRLHVLDTTLYETDPLNMPWTYVDVDLRPVGHATIAGCNLSPMQIDETGRRLFFIDSRSPAVLALTLAGHPLGEHKPQLVADLTGKMPSFTAYSQGLLGCASMPFIWVPEHRSLVLLAEPLQHMAGPSSVSLTINVDTGAVTDGPRFPSRVNGLPWFPGAGCWYPPTQELILYACYNDYYGMPSWAAWGATPGTTAIQEMYRYKWQGGSGPPQPWKWTQLKVGIVKP